MNRNDDLRMTSHDYQSSFYIRHSSFACLLVACLLVTPLFALPPLFVPEWTRQLASPPRLVRAIRWQIESPAELLVGLESGELLLFSGDGNRVLADYSCGEPVIDACPVRDSSGAAKLAVALSRRVILLNRRLARLNEVALPIETGDHLSFLRAGDITGDRTEELLGFTDRSVWTLTQNGSALRHFDYRAGGAGNRTRRPPQQVMVRDMTQDQQAEVMVFDGLSLTVLDATGQELLSAQLDFNSDRNEPRDHSFDVGDIDGDGRMELLALWRSSSSCRVSCWNLPDLTPRWTTPIGTSGSPADFRMLRLAGSFAYCVGDCADRTWCLARLDSAGRVAVVNSPEAATGEVVDVNNCEEYLVLTLDLPIGLQAVAVSSPDLAAIDIQGFGYNGVEVHELVADRVDNDDRTDLLIARGSPSGEQALDVFRNNRRALGAALDSARAACENAVREGNRDGIRRTERRLAQMELKVGQRSDLAPQIESVSRSRRDRRTNLSIGLALGLAIAALLIGLSWRRLRVGRARRADRLVRPLADLLALCSDTIALDHIFVSKGNTAGAISRIEELRRRHRLPQDPDLARIRSGLEPYYSHYIYRLINRPKTVDFLAWMLETIRALPLEQGLNVVTLTREQLVQQLREERFKGNWLVKLHNWDAPDALEHLRIYSDRMVERWLEHALADNLRHAQSWSAVALEYTVNTTWNRKLAIHFLNDGPGTVDLSQSSTHLGAQFQELHRLFGDFLEFSRSPREMMEYEKYWVRIWDYLSVLEDTHRRQTRGGTGDL
jgi:hypothetical protein